MDSAAITETDLKSFYDEELEMNVTVSLRSPGSSSYTVAHPPNNL